MSLLYRLALLMDRRTAQMRRGWAAVTALVLLLACSLCPGVEFTLQDTTTVDAESISMSKETLSTFIIAKKGDETNSYKYSQVVIDSLPADLKTEFLAYQAAQLQKRLIIKKDKWVHRDEVLLDADPRYSYASPLAKVGNSLINFVNTTDETVTIGIRWRDKGFEMHVDSKKKKGSQVPDGSLTYIMVEESDDGTQLIAQKAAPVALAHNDLTVTITKSDDAPEKDIGLIPIPKEYQVAHSAPAPAASDAAAGPADGPIP